MPPPMYDKLLQRIISLERKYELVQEQIRTQDLIIARLKAENDELQASHAASAWKIDGMEMELATVWRALDALRAFASRAMPWWDELPNCMSCYRADAPSCCRREAKWFVLNCVLLTQAAQKNTKQINLLSCHLRPAA